MASGMFNTEGIKNNDWETMLEARREFEASLSNSSGGADFGQMMLILGAAVLGAILIAMAIAVG
jgi:hypothetical protein